MNHHSKTYNKVCNKEKNVKKSRLYKKESKKHKTHKLLQEHRQAVNILYQIYNDEIKYYAAPTLFWDIGRLIQCNKRLAGGQKLKFLHFLKSILRPGNTQILSSPRALYTIFCCHKHWLRLPERWQPDAYKNFAKVHSWEDKCRLLLEDLLQYLFVKYSMPAFMNKAWQTNNHKHLMWFIQMGKGQSVRDVKDFPANMTSKMAHFFMQAPPYYSIDKALFYGQVCGWGGNDALCDQLQGVALQHIQNDGDFLRQVVQFFAQYPNLVENNKVALVINFINVYKYQGQRVYIREKGIVDRPAANPKFSLKGRTEKSLLRIISEWQRSMKLLAENFNGLLTYWTIREIPDFEYWSESQKCKYKITQLINSYELWQEGNLMRHCVGSYAQKCMNGNSSIWAMTKVNKQGEETKCVTIELCREGVVREVKGKQNRTPIESEVKVIREWTNKVDISLSIDYE